MARIHTEMPGFWLSIDNIQMLSHSSGRILLMAVVVAIVVVVVVTMW